jgi:hypothetical protein
MLGSIVTFLAICFACSAMWVYWMFTPSPITPNMYPPAPAMPRSGSLEPNVDLISARAAFHVPSGCIAVASSTSEMKGLFTGCNDGSVGLWRGGTWELLTVIKADQGLITSLLLSPDEKKLYIGHSMFGVLQLPLTGPKNVATRLPVFIRERPLSFVSALAFSTDKKTLLIAEGSDTFEGSQNGAYYDIMEARPHGSICAVQEDKLANNHRSICKVIASKLYLPTSMLMLPDNKLLVAELPRYRVICIHLSKKMAETNRTSWLSNLHAFPFDVVYSSNHKSVMVSLIHERTSFIDFLHSHPVLKYFFFKLHPVFNAPPSLARWGMLLRCTLNGSVLESHGDEEGRFVAAPGRVAVDADGVWIASALDGVRNWNKNVVAA